jgi:hypothetical protein
LTTWPRSGDDKVQQQVSGVEDKIQVKVFLVDSGKTVVTGLENIRQLPEQLRQEFTTIKYLAFLFHLKVNKLLPDLDETMFCGLIYSHGSAFISVERV